MLCSGVQASDQGVVLQTFRSEVSLFQTGAVSVLWKELNTENKMKTISATFLPRHTTANNQTLET